MLAAEREAVACGERGRAHRVELFVRVDARPVDARRQQRVDEKRADDDRAEHDHGPAALGRRARDVRARREPCRRTMPSRAPLPRSGDGRWRIGNRACADGAETLRITWSGTVANRTRTADRQQPRAPRTPSVPAPLSSRPVSMNVTGHARRLAAPVGRPLRRAAVGLRTRDWAPHSRLFLEQEAAEWVLSYEARQLARTAAALGIELGPRRWARGIANQSIFHLSQFTLLLHDFEPLPGTTSASRTSTAGRGRRGCPSSTPASTRCAHATPRSTASR